MTITEIKKELDAMGVDYSEAKVKADYEALYLKELEKQNRDPVMISKVSLEELDTERKQIEQIKAHEQSVILSPEQFDYERNRIAQQPKQSNFNFIAGKLGKRRFFRVLGFNDEKYVYRGAEMDYKDAKVYFFGQSYDALFGHNSKDIVTVEAWLKTPSGYQRTLVGKAELAMPITLSLDKAKKIINAIKAQGDDPSS